MDTASHQSLKYGLHRVSKELHKKHESGLTQDKSSQLVHEPSYLLAERPTKHNISEAFLTPYQTRLVKYIQRKNYIIKALIKAGIGSLYEIVMTSQKALREMRCRLTPLYPGMDTTYLSATMPFMRVITTQSSSLMATGTGWIGMMINIWDIGLNPRRRSLKEIKI